MENCFFFIISIFSCEHIIQQQEFRENCIFRIAKFTKFIIVNRKKVSLFINAESFNILGNRNDAKSRIFFTQKKSNT